ncbi:MAG: phosphotransferase [Gemmatimonadota bacterium]
MSRLERQLTAALAVAPRMRDCGPFTVHVLERIRGEITTLDAIELRCAATRRRYWVKRYARARDAEKEWAFLSHRAPFGGFDLADPAAYLPPPLDAMVSVHATGERLDHRLHAQSRRHAIEQDCFDVGRWLAALHRSDAVPLLGAHPTAAIAHAIEHRLHRVAAKWRVPASLRRTVLDETERRLAQTTADGLARVRTHGDFGPFNIFIDGDAGGGTIIDPSFEPSIDALGNRCARGEDAARFLTCIEFEEGLSPPERQDAGRRFLDGYGSSGVDVRTPALTLFRFKYRLQGLIDMWATPIADVRRRGVTAMIEGWLAE